MIESLTGLFKALGEPTRLKIVRLLAETELCVCELEAVLNISQPRVSQHLKVLKTAGVVKERKERQRSFFRLDPALKTADFGVFSAFMGTAVGELAELQEEAQRLAVLPQNEEVNACKHAVPIPAAETRAAR
ncbi:MAG: ArsR/SmtB family transcription factor [Solirubrobacterales bacterium]